MVNIGSVCIKADVASTKAFYKTQENIIEGCQCDDCRYYYYFFLGEQLEIYKALSSIGVDVNKNIDSAQTGVYCVRGDSGQLIHCIHDYRIFGEICNVDNGETTYSKNELGYSIQAHFSQDKEDSISVQLTLTPFNGHRKLS